MTFGELVIWPESPLCVGTTIYASPNMDATCGEPVGVFRWAPETTNCPPVYWTNACRTSISARHRERLFRTERSS